MARCLTAHRIFIAVSAIILIGLLGLLVVRPALERGGFVELLVVVVAAISILLFERWLRTR